MQDVWFGNQQKPTINNVLAHFKKIEKADFEYPIIISSEGIVLDGVHRICKAYLVQRKTIPAVRFADDPEPDKIHSNSVKE
jgi:disulfide oxidoreductase YuzD